MDKIAHNLKKICIKLHHVLQMNFNFEVVNYVQITFQTVINALTKNMQTIKLIAQTVIKDLN